MSKDENEKTGKQTLTDESIVDGRKMGRRSAIGVVGAAIAGAVGLAVGLSPEEAEAQGCTDSDGGYGADPAGYGRRCYRPRTGCTDSDPSDPGGGGRNCYRRPPVIIRRRCTDNDTGRWSDPVGRGRRC